MRFADVAELIQTALRLAAEAVGGDVEVEFNAQAHAWTLQSKGQWFPDYVRVHPRFGEHDLLFEVVVHRSPQTLSADEALRIAERDVHFARAAVTVDALVKGREWSPDEIRAWKPSQG